MPMVSRHLIELAGAIEPPKQHRARSTTLTSAAHRRTRNGSVARNGKPIPVHQRDGDVTAEHREAAMREVDEVHHAERDRQPDRQQEQQHAVGEAVEQNAEKRGAKSWRRVASTCAASSRLNGILDVLDLVELDVDAAGRSTFSTLRI